MVPLSVPESYLDVAKTPVPLFGFIDFQRYRTELFVISGYEFDSSLGTT